MGLRVLSTLEDQALWVQTAITIVTADRWVMRWDGCCYRLT